MYSSCEDLLLEEAVVMLRAESPNVAKLLGVFRGLTPLNPAVISVGLVMELMERGSLKAFQVSHMDALAQQQ